MALVDRTEDEARNLSAFWSGLISAGFGTSPRTGANNGMVIELAVLTSISGHGSALLFVVKAISELNILKHGIAMV